MNHSQTVGTFTTVIIIQDDVLKKNAQITKLITRLACISFVLGIFAFFLHYISINRLSNFSPYNAGIISGTFFVLAGLASICAVHRQNSSKYFQHARIWSTLVCIIFSPALIVVSIVALVIDGQEMMPLCPNTQPLSRAILFGNSLELYASNVPCFQTIQLMNLAQILNVLQLIIGITCFVVQLKLISLQQKVLQRLDENSNGKLTDLPQTVHLDIDSTPTYSDPPPKYEDSVAAQLNCK